MSTHDGPWPHGTPCWVDLQVDDPDAAATFYTALFNWDVAPGDDAMGGYRMCTIGGRAVAGLSPKPPGMETMPSTWNTYLACDDADASAAQIEAAGGQVIMGPENVGPFGRMFFAVDPGGAAFGGWQAGEHAGAGLVNEAGALVWEDCWTPDLEAAKAFYAKVFGYTYEELPGDMTYEMFKLADRGIGGIALIGADQPAEMPAYWNVYFSVPDTDAAVLTASDAGAQVVMPAEDTPYGRMAIVQGPHHEQFTLIAGDDSSSGEGGSAG